MLYTQKIKFFWPIIILTIAPALSLAAEQEPPLAGSWPSILPPLIAIVMALLFKRVIPALFMGVFLGAWLIEGLTLPGMWRGLLSSFEVYVLNALANRDHAAILLFSLMIGGMVGIISRNGGMHGIVKYIVEWADNARHACMATATMEIFILGYSSWI